MENKNNRNGLIILLIVTVVFLAILCILLASGTIDLSKKDIINNNQNNNINDLQETNTNPLSTICTMEDYDKLEVLSMENKTEEIHAIGGSKKGYNITTTVTKQHNYTSNPENEELYSNDFMGTLYVLYKNNLYYTSQEEIISKYCSSDKSTATKKLTCDYTKFNDAGIEKFNYININLNLKAIGSYGNSGSGAPILYAITNDGKVINIPDVLSNNYSECGIIYDDSEYPIDRIFNLYFYDGVEYTILLKNGTLITRYVDREHPIEIEE